MTEVIAQTILHNLTDRVYHYQEYRKLVEHLLEENKTTGENHSEAMLHYTKMNVHRMKRLDKTITLTEELRERLRDIEVPMIWLVLTEGWCGDAAQLIPVFQKMAEASENIGLKLILRDKNLDIMDQFLTDGKSRSIPKLICLHADTGEVLGDWGPRPAEAQSLYKSLRNTPGVEYREASEHLHKWYADDKTRSVQKELLHLLDHWEKRHFKPVP